MAKNKRVCDLEHDRPRAATVRVEFKSIRVSRPGHPMVREAALCATHARAYPKELPILAELLPNIETPVEIIGGLWDWAVPPSNYRFLHERIPNSKLDLIDAGHFTWEDAPEEYPEIVTRWWAGGYAALDHGSKIVTR